MFDALVNILVVVVIVVLVELIGLPNVIGKAFGRSRDVNGMATRMDDLEARILKLEQKTHSHSEPGT